ncbi:hypothetical protein SAMN02745664_101255 [Moraxella cuniculi DSM 21768]|uniref:Uncharacterized protein n=1 Tax=Moraxella cuniculi DSM 21768 TaxID=1122245 RepID=A0A1N7DGV5_9GAMM|nr:hypothetical protein [Moraxella cuniculi]OOS08050.1 hypothetical protein B0189_01580 [Moraxella cuniculi]SIR75020.1 hypothetical protein SAMN02745664_101255 [Moraxella cuniculi DSM 21768]
MKMVLCWNSHTKSGTSIPKLFLIKENEILSLYFWEKIIYEDGSEWIPPFSEGIHIINEDKTEFLVIFREEPSSFSQIKEPPWYFSPPAHAAIYYSDGTLKHQITIPRGADGNFIFTEAGCSTKYPHLRTVILQFINPYINKGLVSSLCHRP